MIVALAGRRIDAAGARTSRFPLANIEPVRERIQRLFTERGARAVIASGACGADLIAHAMARTLGLRRVMVLPFSAALFRDRSVTDRPGAWGPLFDELVADSRETGALVELGALPDPSLATTAYSDVNHAIVERALALAAPGPRSGVLAVGVWDGVSRGADDITRHFLDSARAAGIPTAEVSTLG